MAMTMVEKILARATGQTSVKAGDVVEPRVDLAMSHENAALVLNRKVAQYVIRPRISIIVQADGLYETSDLRVACEQVLAWKRQMDLAAASKKCIGVRFAFTGKEREPEVRLRRGAAGETVLPAVTGAAFSDDPNATFRVVNYRFADGTDAGQVVMTDAPLSIAALIE